MLIWIRTEATKRPSLSSLGLFALRDYGIYCRDHAVRFPRVDDDNRWTPLQRFYTVGSHKFRWGIGLHTFDFANIDSLTRSLTPFRVLYDRVVRPN
jgi:hypothetical protein